MNVLKATELCTLKQLIQCYVNFTSVLERKTKLEKFIYSIGGWERHRGFWGLTDSIS